MAIVAERQRQRPPGPSWRLRQRLSWALPWAVPLLLLVCWQLGAAAGLISARVLPAPLDVLGAAVRLAEQQNLLHDVAVSTRRAFSGLLVGGSIGFTLGLLNGIIPIAERLLDSTVQMVRTIPHLALLPLVILWFGIGEEARLFLVSAGVFFPIYLNTFHGVRTVDRGLKEMGAAYGLSPLTMFWQIILPGALPSILVGLRFALGVMWLTLIVAESLSSNAGIGYITMNAREFMQTDVLVLGITIYALLGKLADSAARLLERRLLAWHPSYQQR